MRKLVLLIAALSLFAVAAVAADISGKWVSETQGRDGTPQTTTYMFKVTGSTFTGTISTARGDQQITDGKVSGDEISFVRVSQGRDGTPQKANFKGKVSGNEIRLTREPGAGGGGGGGGGRGGGGGGGRGQQEIVLKRAS